MHDEPSADAAEQALLDGAGDQRGLVRRARARDSVTEALLPSLYIWFKSFKFDSSLHI